RHVTVSPFVAFLVMGAGSVVASAFILLRFRWCSSSDNARIDLSRVFMQHWAYGRWALATSIVVWIPGNVYYAILGRQSGLAQAGELRALLNLFIPLGHILNSLTKILLPYASGKYGLHGRAGAWTRAAK